MTARTPAPNATGVGVATNTTATFSVNVTGVGPATFQLQQVTAAGTPIGAVLPAAVTYNATTRVATLDPNANLAPGTLYRATLTGGAAAIRNAATGAPLVTTAWTFTTAAAVPGAPVIGPAASGALGGPITATANWTPPATDGGSPITGYRVTALRVILGIVVGTTTSAVQPATARSLEMTLPALGTYQFTVQAINAVGAGPQSARSAAVTGR